LPPQVSAASFAAAIQEFQAAIGKQWVFSSEEDLELYRDQYSFFWDTPEEHLASAALARRASRKFRRSYAFRISTKPRSIRYRPAAT
jgi:hypothetical protein